MKVACDIYCISVAVAGRCRVYAEKVNREFEHPPCASIEADGKVVRIKYHAGEYDYADTDGLEARVVGYRDALEEDLKS